ncbi:MAG TPA: radical SAM protein [Polyangiaceae bacterium LLY-WYZ-15_(1-7)]|nr:hypothetical protein [Sandaracinus sp.]HJK91569.1 radical SAM protein [Polyangiaceae bacterium LLY-WYZ-15_(1-7)]MBJ70016.1 hypothetical protein [Sandaracinus sp.]HJL05663.1 radical SAM protein [Polyangiaceae bacterium LLY-WYZ-15_(1-7)]HJL08051.1 radical SAM protein [Polyangiaceae bacterium LLY-WYZ-15_(1-7)]
MSVPFKGKTSVAALVSKLAGEETPLSAMIEIADRCNEKCVHCYQVQGQKGEMTTEEIFGVLDELAEMGVLFLTISGGEATLRKDFLDIVAYARKKKFAVKLFTNGLKVTRELASKLGELAVQEVQISLYSSHANVHDWVTNVPGSWEKTTAAARYLVDAGVKVVLKTPVMRINEDDTDEFIALCEEIGTDYMFDPGELMPREDGARAPQALSRSAVASMRLRKNPRLVPNAKAEFRAPRLEASPCGACKSIHIEANGELRPCTALTLPIGHARDGVQKSWRDNEEAVFIRSLRWKDILGCRDCDLHPYCVRCHQTSRVEGGDALAPYPSACRGALQRYARALGYDPESAGVLGPFREVQRGRLEMLPVRETERDRELRRRHAWIRATPSEATEPVVPGSTATLVRPGGIQRSEKVPLPVVP